MANCTFSGGPYYNGDGTVNYTFAVRVQTSGGDIGGTIVLPDDDTYLPDPATGVITFVRLYGVTITVDSPSNPNLIAPVTLIVPSQSTYDIINIMNLSVSTPPPNGGFTVTDGAQIFRAGTFSFTGTGFTLTQPVAGEVDINASVGSGISSVGTIDSQTKSANAAVISSSSLILQAADATFPGVVSTGTQTIAGNKTLSGVTKLGSGTNYNEGGQASLGATAAAVQAAIGSSGTPNSTNTPVAIFQKQDSTNPGSGVSVIPFQFSVRKQTGNGNLYASHTFLRQESATLADAVAITGSILANPSSSPGITQTHWALWGRAERLSSATRISGAEFDAINSTNTDASRLSNNANATFGINIVATGFQADQSSDPTVSARNTAGILIQTGNNNTKGAFFSGILFDANTVVDYGIDFNALGTTPISPIRAANNTYYTWRNAAGDNNISAFGVDSSNTTRIRGDDATNAIRFSNTDNSVTYGTISANPIGLTMVGFISASHFVSGRTNLSLANGLNSNIDITTSSFARIGGPSGAFSVGGFLNGADGRILIMFNSVAQTMTIVNEDASSTAANRIATLTGGNVALRSTAQSCATFIYSGLDSRWVLVATN